MTERDIGQPLSISTWVTGLQLGDKPDKTGCYLVWSDIISQPDCEHTQRHILYWDGKYWHYSLSDQRFRSKIYAYIGPLATIKKL